MKLTTALLIALTAATPATAGKLGTFLQYSGSAPIAFRLESADFWCTPHNKDNGTALIQMLGVVDSVSRADRAAIVSDVGLYFKAAKICANKLGGIQSGGMRKVNGQAYILELSK